MRDLRARLPVLALLAAKAIQLANALVVSIAVVWGFGLASVGTLALASLPAALGALVVGCGLPSALPRFQASEGARATAGALLSTLAILPFAALAFAYSAIMGHGPDEMVAVLALALAGALIGQVNVQQTLYVLQGRTLWAPLAPTVHLLGTGLALLAPTFLDFTLILLVTRALGCVAGFLPLAFDRVDLRRIRPALAEAFRFAPLDIVGLLADQLPVVLLAVLLDRAELGLYGLIRQFVSVADTPGWSYVLSNYPALVRDVGASASALARGNERLAWISAAASLVASSALAVTVYRVPAILPALPLVLLPLPARYLNNFCDQALRASGHVRDCLMLCLMKSVLSLVLFSALATSQGFWGAVAASALLSLLAGLLYRWRFLARFPDVLRPIRPWRLA
jgi:O-antigen/teichoic acid export membrane protein